MITCGAAVHDVVGLEAVGAVLPRLLVAAQQEDRVVRGRGDGEQRQQVRRVRRQRNDADVSEERHHAAGRGDLDGHRHQREQGGDDGPVDDQQHHEDHAEGQRGDLDVAALADENSSANSAAGPLT